MAYYRRDWLPWIEAYDPDIIYSYTDIDEPAISAIHERFGPAYLTNHQFYGDEEQRSFPPRAST